MWRVSLRDLQWRKRRFLVAVTVGGLVLAVTLLLSGAFTSIDREAGRIVDAVDADGWIVADGTSGPFTASSFVGVDRLDEIAALPGVERADPLVSLHTTMDDDGELLDVNVIGVAVGGIGAPDASKGRAVASAGEAVVDTRLPGVDVGDTLVVGGHELAVVGEAKHITFYFGTPTIFTTVTDAQAIGLYGQPFASAIVTIGVPGSVPAGLTLLDDAAVEDDLQRPAENGKQTVAFVNVLLWIVAAGVIGSVVYLSALERHRDFAIMKATGTTTSTLFIGVFVQALVLCVAAGVLGAILSKPLAGGFPFAVEVTTGAYVQLAIVLVVVAGLASLLGMRRIVHADPALAFGGGA